MIMQQDSTKPCNIVFQVTRLKCESRSCVTVIPEKKLLSAESGEHQDLEPINLRQSGHHTCKNSDSRRLYSV